MLSIFESHSTVEGLDLSNERVNGETSKEYFLSLAFKLIYVWYASGSCLSFRFLGCVFRIIFVLQIFMF